MGTTEEEVGHADLVSGGATGLHKHKLNNSDAPDGSVNFNKQQATSLVIENRTSDPGTPVDGQVWLRTDL